MFSRIFLIALSVLGLSTMQANANDILFDSLQWRARVVVLTGERNDPLLSQQIELLRENLDGLKNREIAVIRFDGDAIYEMSDFSNFSYRGRYDMDANLQRYYEGEMQSDNNIFSVALFGKDGYFKKVWKDREEAVPLSEVFAEIDAMPMRQREMAEE